MRDLIERLEGLTAPSRELDVLIAIAIDWRWDDWEEGELTVKQVSEQRGVDWLVERANDGGFSLWRHIPRYTASIDAAMTLVPEGWWLAGICFCPPDFRTERDKEYSAQIAGPITWGTIDYGGPEEPLYEHESGDAATPAIALCIAALKATP